MGDKRGTSRLDNWCTSDGDPQKQLWSSGAAVLTTAKRYAVPTILRVSTPISHVRKMRESQA